MKVSQFFTVAAIALSILSAATQSKAQSVHNEQYISLQNYTKTSRAITFGAPTTLDTNYTFLLPSTGPTALNQTLAVNSVDSISNPSNRVYTLGWSSAALTNSWMLQGNSGLTSSNNYLGTLDATPVRFITNGLANERMRISATGQVGIGTTSPGQLLEVKGGNVLLSNSGTASQLQMQGTGTGITTFAAGAQGATNIGYTLPTSQGDSLTILQNNGSGVLKWVDGSTLMSGKVGSVQFAIKGSDETVTNSSTLQDDNDLYFTIGANETWELVAQLEASTCGKHGDDMKVAITIPSGSLHVFVTMIGGDGGGNPHEEGEWLTTSGSACEDFDIDDDSDEQTELIFQGLIVGGSTGGTVHIQWAPEDKDNDGSIKVKKNSYLKATRAK